MRLSRVLWNSASKVAAASQTVSVSGKSEKLLDLYSQFNPSPLSIKQFIDFGKWASFHKLSEVMLDQW